MDLLCQFKQAGSGMMRNCEEQVPNTREYASDVQKVFHIMRFLKFEYGVDVRNKILEKLV